MVALGIGKVEPAFVFGIEHVQDVLLIICLDKKNFDLCFVSMAMITEKSIGVAFGKLSHLNAFDKKKKRMF